MAERAGYKTINFDEADVRQALLELTGGRGPDKCIDAVGMEATRGKGPDAAPAICTDAWCYGPGQLSCWPSAMTTSGPEPMPSMSGVRAARRSRSS